MAYARSKTANMLFTLSLVQKLGSRGLRSFGVDPGVRMPRSSWDGAVEKVLT